MDNRAEVNDIRVRLQEDIDLLHDINDHIMQITERMEEEQRQGMPELQRQLNQQRRAAAQAEARIAADKALLASLSVNTEFETRLENKITRLNNNILFILTRRVNSLVCFLPDREVGISKIGDILNLNAEEVKICLRQHGQSDRGTAAVVRHRLAIFAGFPEPEVDSIFF